MLLIQWGQSASLEEEGDTTMLVLVSSDTGTTVDS